MRKRFPLTLGPVELFSIDSFQLSLFLAVWFECVYVCVCVPGLWLDNWNNVSTHVHISSASEQTKLHLTQTNGTKIEMLFL